MKRIVSIVFIGLFLLNSCGYYFVFYFNQNILQSEMRHLVRSGYFKDQYERLTIPNPSADPDFKWVDKREFRYKGRLYDLVSMEIKGSSVTFHCINDKKEEALIARADQFRQLLTGTTSPARERNNRIILNLLIQQALPMNYSLLSPANSTPVVFFDPSPPLNSINLNPPAPPPRNA